MSREVLAELRAELSGGGQFSAEQLDALFTLVALRLAQKSGKQQSTAELERLIGPQAGRSAAEISAAVERYYRENVPPALSAAFRRALRDRNLERQPPGAVPVQLEGGRFQERSAAKLPQLRISRED